jgi:hypothetical protein
VFFAQLAANGGSWGLAFRTALLVTIGFVLVALVAAVADVTLGHRHRPAPDHGEMAAAH